MQSQKNPDSAVLQYSEDKTYPDGKAYRSLSLANTLKIAETLGTPIKKVELVALGQEIVPERYARNQRTLNCAQQHRLLQSRVAVVGQGGLGGTVTEQLARLGVGELVLMDGDRFEDSNLNRQLLATIGTLDMPKSEAGRRRVLEINPAVSAVTHDEFLTAENAETLLRGAQVVVDCLDNLPTRYIVAATASKLGIPMVSGAVAGMAGQVTVIYPEDGGLERIYGDPAQLPPKGAETALGTIPFAVSTVACMECAEVAKILLELPHVLRNRMMVMDLADNTLEVLELG